MKKPTVFNQSVDEIRQILKKIDALAAPKADLRRQLTELAAQQTDLLRQIKVIDRESNTLQAKARKKVLELTELHGNGEAKEDPVGRFGFATTPTEAERRRLERK